MVQSFLKPHCLGNGRLALHMAWLVCESDMYFSPHITIWFFFSFFSAQKTFQHVFLLRWFQLLLFLKNTSTAKITCKAILLSVSVLRVWVSRENSLVRPERAEGLAVLLHCHFSSSREDRSTPVSDRHSEQTRGNSPVLPQGTMQLHGRQRILTLEWFSEGSSSLDGAVKSLPRAASVPGPGVSVGWRPLQSWFGGRWCLWLLRWDETERRKLEKLI